MKTRIAIWAMMGAIVVALWSIFFMTTHQNLLHDGGFGRAILYFTCPIALAARRPMSLYFVLAVNAVLYALVGAIVEAVRHYRLRSPSN